MNGEKLLDQLEFVDEELINESYMTGMKRKEIAINQRKRLGANAKMVRLGVRPYQFRYPRR